MCEFLMLAAVLETSITSSYRSSPRALLSRTSLNPSRRSISRLNSRFSHSAVSRAAIASCRFLGLEQRGRDAHDDDAERKSQKG